MLKLSDCTFASFIVYVLVFYKLTNIQSYKGALSYSNIFIKRYYALITLSYRSLIIVSYG